MNARFASSRARLLAAALGLVLVIGAVVAGGIAFGAARSNAAPRPAASAPAGYAGGIQDPVAAVAPTPVGTPVRVIIPQIGVNSDLEDLKTDSTGKLQPPALPGRAGWYGAGVVPGQVGPAIIAGHVDYAAGPGVFERLDELTPGSRVQVQMSTGATLTFRVDGATQSAKRAFPTAAVYGPTPDPQLRLITCAGTFDAKTARYPDNLVVFATLVR